MFELNRNNIMRIIMMALVGVLGVYVLLYGTWYMALLALAVIIIEFLKLTNEQWRPHGRAEAYTITYNHPDGQFFHLMDPRDLPSSSIGTETWYDGDGKGYWPIWLPGRNEMTDILILDPTTGSPKISMVHDYINTNIEFRNLGQFRSYFRLHTERKGKESSLDILKGYSPTITLSKAARHQRKQEAEEDSGSDED